MAAELKNHEQVQELVRKKIDELQKKRFWGDFVIQFREGNAVMLRKHETIPVERCLDGEDIRI